MAIDRRPIGVFGGTFDPIHHAHLRIALDVLESLDLAEVRFVPSHQPPHRGRPAAAPRQRLRMLELATAGQPGFTVDDRELRRDGPSFTIDTLASLRRDFGQRPLCLLLGLDAFLDFYQWHRWQAIPSFAHLVVMRRPGYEYQLPEALETLASRHHVANGSALRDSPAGGFLFHSSVTQLAVSASAVRALVSDGRSPRYLVPESVYDFIDRDNLYRSRGK